MMGSQGPTTRASLMGRLGDGADDRAWGEFFAAYDPLMAGWCRRFGLDPEAAEELRQRAWAGLARRMREFRYDPGQSFRGWLWTYFQRRALDFLRERRRERGLTLDLEAAGDALLYLDRPAGLDDGATDDPGLLELLRQGEEAQAAVRDRVRPETWRVFWLIEVEGASFREAADLVGKT